MNAAVALSLADRMNDLGGIAAERVRLTPPPGSAGLDDLIVVNLRSKPLCELIDNTLVEKAMGYEASVVAAAILEILRRFVAASRVPRSGQYTRRTLDSRGSDVCRSGQG